ncbi:MAG: M18 family aminopeptidase, partial [Microbacterium sp.]
MTHAAARAHVDDLAAFVTASPSSYHAAAESVRRLEGEGFSVLREEDAWD